MQLDIVTSRALAATFALAALWALEGAWPMFRGRREHTLHHARNVGLGVFNALVGAGLAAWTLLLVAQLAEQAEFGLLRWVSLPAMVEWVAAFVLFDLWQYAWHRLNHRVPLLWRFHAVHHSDAEMDASTAVRFHTGELVLSMLARMVVVPLLGISIEQVAVYELVLLPLILFHHANIRIPAGVDRALRMVIVTPWMHWVHHSNQQPETDSNYASVFSVWDRLFGSFRLRGNPSEITLGLDGFTEGEWRPLWGLLAIPFLHDFSSNTKRKDYPPGPS